MKTKSVVNKVKKVFGVKMYRCGNVLMAKVNGVVIEAHDQESDCLFIVVRRENDVNDSMTDYSAGGMYYTIKGAIDRFQNLMLN